MLVSPISSGHVVVTLHISTLLTPVILATLKILIWFDPETASETKLLHHFFYYGTLRGHCNPASEMTYIASGAWALNSPLTVNVRQPDINDDAMMTCLCQFFVLGLMLLIMYGYLLRIM